jgi:hypothetical protein
MSSFNVHKAHVLNSSLPINNRFSHLRSCLNKVANLLGCSRAALVEKISFATGVNVEQGVTEVDLLTAFNYLLHLRTEKLGSNF